MTPLLSYLTEVTIWTAVPMAVLTLLIRLAWRRGKNVEEP
jgi:hypothetical protein